MNTTTVAASECDNLEIFKKMEDHKLSIKVSNLLSSFTVLLDDFCFHFSYGTFCIEKLFASYATLFTHFVLCDEGEFGFESDISKEQTKMFEEWKETMIADDLEDCCCTNQYPELISSSISTNLDSSTKKNKFYKFHLLAMFILKDHVEQTYSNPGTVVHTGRAKLLCSLCNLKSLAIRIYLQLQNPETRYILNSDSNEAIKKMFEVCYDGVEHARLMDAMMMCNECQNSKF